MMSVKQDIRHVHSLLKHTDKWYVEMTAPDIDLFQEIGERAKENATERLTKMSVSSLYTRYLKWSREDQIIPLSKSLYHVFLDDLAWDLGLSTLKGRERDLYCESVVLKIKYI